MANQQVLVQLVRVKCLDETGGATAEHFGNDEIYLSGVAFDAAGATYKVDPFEIYAHFDDGEVKEFSPPRTIFTLPVPDGAGFPKNCGFTLLLCERADGNGHRDATNKLHAAMPDIIAKAKADAEVPVEGAGGTDGDIQDGVVDIIIKYVGGWIVDQVWSGLKDNVFEPQTASLSVASNDFRWGDGTKLSPETTLIFTGHDGKYYVTYYWEIRQPDVTRTDNAPRNDQDRQRLRDAGPRPGHPS